MAGFGSPPVNEIVKLGLAGQAIPDNQINFYVKGGPVTTGTEMQTIGASNNYKLASFVAILLNRMNGYTKLATSNLWPEADLWAWLAWYLDGQLHGTLGYCAGEGDANVYTPLFRVPVRVLRGLAIRKGGQAELVADCDLWLKVWAVHQVACFCAPWLGGTLPQAECVYGPRDQPGALYDCRLPADDEMPHRDESREVHVARRQMPEEVADRPDLDLPEHDLAVVHLGDAGRVGDDGLDVALALAHPPEAGLAHRGSDPLAVVVDEPGARLVAQERTAVGGEGHLLLEPALLHARVADDAEAPPLPEQERERLKPLVQGQRWPWKRRYTTYTANQVMTTNDEASRPV